MAVAATLQRFLEERRARYRLRPHAHTETSEETAEASAVSGECLAKAVLIDAGGEAVLAVVPATHTVLYEPLEQALGRPVRPADTARLAEVCPDCSEGALPPFGAAWNLPVFVDHALVESPTVYCEAGDHETLIELEQAEFRRLLEDARPLALGRHRG